MPINKIGIFAITVLVGGWMLSCHFIDGMLGMFWPAVALAYTGIIMLTLKG